MERLSKKKRKLNEELERKMTGYFGENKTVLERSSRNKWEKCCSVKNETHEWTWCELRICQNDWIW